MPLYQAARIEVLDELVNEVLRFYGRGRTIVAIDGVDGAGKSRFAADFAERFRKAGHTAFTASMDAFRNQREVRYAQGRMSALGCYEDSYDYDAFKRVLIEPFRMGGSTGFNTEYFDLDRDALVVDPTWHTAGADAVLIVEGVFLMRPELRTLWHWSLWLEADPAVALQRIALRYGTNADPEDAFNRRHLGAQEIYQQRCDPRRKVDATVDNTDPAHPRRIFSDAC